MNKRLWEPVEATSLWWFRRGFGLLALVGVARFFVYGWIDLLYIQPPRHLSYWGFEWIVRPPAWGMYGLFLGMAACAAAALADRWARPALLLYAALFSYVELIEQATYLNHYYLISLLAIILALAPIRLAEGCVPTAPRWAVWWLRGQVSCVYVFAALAKLHPDWLLYGQPLYIWLRARSDWPVIGPLFEHRATAIAMSWGGLLFDATIPLWLSFRRTRAVAYAVVVFFHVLTWWLFPIGIFPWVMMLSATLLLPTDWPRRLLRRPPLPLATLPDRAPAVRGATIAALTLWMLFQTTMPLRHLAYPGDASWSDEGFRWAWKVMASERSGSVTFRVVDPRTGRTWRLLPSAYFTPLQERALSYQPDTLLVAAHHIARDFAAHKHIPDARVHADVWVSWNGRPAARLIDPTIDLAHTHDSLRPKPWVLPAPKGPPL